MKNFAADLLATSRDQAERRCLSLPDGNVWTYADLERRSALFAQLLRDRGVEPTDRVLVQLEKSPDCVALYLAVLRAGAVFVPLNVAYTASEVAYFIDDASPRLVVVGPDAAPALREVAAARAVELAVLDLASWSRPDGLAPDRAELHPTVGAHEWLLTESADPSSADDAIVDRAGDDLAAIVYTSGTTGRSKGAMLTHANLRSNADTLVEVWGMKADDVLVHALPIFHVHGLFVALHTSFLVGAEVRFLPRFDAERVAAELDGATVLMGVPTFYTRLLALEGFGRQQCASMRLFVSGSAPLLAATHLEFESRTGHRVLERYGMSEAGMITSNPLDGDRVAGTVGYALPGVDVRVCDRESGAQCDASEVGVVEVRGPNVFAGYWRQPEKTAAEHRADGFFVTGDLGAVDEHGRLTLVGRDKDLVISGGYNIYPKEIEAVLDAVDGVRESAVVGVPHDDLGEGVVAVLVAEHVSVAQEELQAALDRELARFKHPRRFQWVDELPRNAMGKVQKAVLRERFADAYR